MDLSSDGPKQLRVRFGEFELDEANALLIRGGKAIPLAPTPFKHFLGGEPLIRSDIFDLIAHARERGLGVTISSNGWRIDEAAASTAQLGL